MTVNEEFPSLKAIDGRRERKSRELMMEFRANECQDLVTLLVGTRYSTKKK